MAIPSDGAARNRAGAERERQRTEQRRHRRHHDRPEAQDAGFVDRRLRRLPRSRSASSAKSIIMIAFFLTMPISKMIPIREITVERRGRRSGQQRANAGGRQRGQDGDRVNEAFVEHAEQDVDRDDSRGDQERLVLQRDDEFGGAACKPGCDRVG